MTKQPEALRLADELDLNTAVSLFNEAVSAELRRLHQINAELLRLVKLVHGSFSGGRVMTFSWEDVEDFENAITKATGETE